MEQMQLELVQRARRGVRPGQRIRRVKDSIGRLRSGSEIVNGMKLCPCCKHDKPTASFYKRADGSLHSWCIECTKASEREKRARNAPAVDIREWPAFKTAAELMRLWPGRKE